MALHSLRSVVSVSCVTYGGASCPRGGAIRPFITWLVVLVAERPTAESPFSQKYCIRMHFKDASPESCSITYMQTFLNKWDGSQTADKRDIVTKHNASKEMHPSVMTTQPEKRG
jgi:hypothetical protein